MDDNRAAYVVRHPLKVRSAARDGDELGVLGSGKPVTASASPPRIESPAGDYAWAQQWVEVALDPPLRGHATGWVLLGTAAQRAQNKWLEPVAQAQQ